ncbi:M28 family peptidase [Candidatus Uabimicrobium amorphum]|uniref:Aminopeptidase n=1 Tax=Uabimicrobium amorphum TaxID=2596890 RepID=A0A5S9F6B6_UABAM|nr:M28 family peptidase [Candidatus Uabimicrobium amorphum]BBM87512.1 aminopeptidase [Candidatus Uabimicrobium amorphum]
MKNLTMSILIVLICSFAVADGLPSYLKVREQQRGDDFNSKVLYAGERVSVVVDAQSMRSADAKEMNRDDLYAVRFLNTDIILPRLKEFGTVLFLDEHKNEAIMSLTDEQKIDELAALLHTKGGCIGCGSIIKLGKPSETLVNHRFNPVAAEIIDQLMTAEPQRNVQELVDLVNIDNVTDFISKLSVYHNRHHRSSTGRQSADYIYNTFKSYERNGITVSQFKHSGTPQPSVIVRAEGTTNPNEIVIIGCHIDSLAGWGSSNRAPGADDNASGTGTVKELLRIISTYNYKFKRTIEFHGYAAEEGGLVGSKEVASRYRSQGKNVVAMIQIDMCLYSTASKPEIWLITNKTSPRLVDLCAKLASQYTDAITKRGPLFAGSSDHASWTGQGYEAIFPFENPQSYNKHIHTANDTIAKSGNFVFAENMAKLAMAFISSIAEPVK